MKTRIERAMVVFGATAMIILVGHHLAWSQDSTLPLDAGAGPVDSTETAPESFEVTAPSDELLPPAGRDQYFSTPTNRQQPGGKSFQQRYQQAVAAIRDAADSEVKANATTQLAEVLGEYFEEDIKTREQELEKIAQQLKKLRDQLSIRQEKKQEIIDLQLRLAVNEADGLGFFRGSNSADGGYGGAGAYGAGGYGAGYGDGAGGYGDYRAAPTPRPNDQPRPAR